PPIYIKLEVPKGIHGGYIGNFLTKEGANDFLIERGQGIQINKASIINQKGKEFIKLEAKLITDEKLEDEMEKYNRELNNKLKENFISIEDHDLVQIDLSGRFFTKNYIISKLIIDSLAKIPSDFIDLINMSAQSHSDKPNIRIIDDYINGEEKTEGIHYSDGEHATYISLRVSRNPIYTTYHEIAHAADDFLFSFISLDEEFKELFKKESANFPEGWYGKTDEKEYFAECFALFYYSIETNNNLKSKAIQTYNFIEKLIHLIQN
ncbi:anthrax toxin lethal factor-related metalloendopeptidase, partial [Bacillus cereus]|uniref:anthrax toxin lethal factor-related metalloendopeptidase n=1 Tax=Bacillus cereus TaxID=1396 RepID=UPI002414325D